MSKSVTKLSIKDIELAILNKHGGCLKVIAVPNVTYGLGWYGEADLIVLSKKGFATEYEIKRSLPDFKNDFKKRKGVHYRKPIYNFAYVVPESIGDKVKAEVEKRFSDDDRPAVYTFNEKSILSKKPICGKLHTKEREFRGCNRPMTDEEKFQLARLGTIRYWSIFDKNWSMYNK